MIVIHDVHVVYRILISATDLQTTSVLVARTPAYRIGTVRELFVSVQRGGAQLNSKRYSPCSVHRNEPNSILGTLDFYPC